MAVFPGRTGIYLYKEANFLEYHDASIFVLDIFHYCERLNKSETGIKDTSG